MKNYILIAFVISLLTICSFQVNAVQGNIYMPSEISLKSNVNHNEITTTNPKEGSISNKISFYIAKTVLKVISPKKKRKKKKKKSFFLWGWILSSLASILFIVLGALCAVLLMEIGVIFYLIGLFLGMLAGIASSVFFILWIVALIDD